MALIDFFKRSFFLQDLASTYLTSIPPFVDHNWQKFRAIKSAFYLTAIDHIPGDYLEFGVFTGSSFVMAMKSYRQMRSISPEPARFFGFDSFEGFGDVPKEDKHPFYTNLVFKSDADIARRNIKRRAKGLPFEICEGYFEKVLTPEK